MKNLNIYINEKLINPVKGLNESYGDMEMPENAIPVKYYDKLKGIIPEDFLKNENFVGPISTLVNYKMHGDWETRFEYMMGEIGMDIYHDETPYIFLQESSNDEDSDYGSSIGEWSRSTVDYKNDDFKNATSSHYYRGDECTIYCVTDGKKNYPLFEVFVEDASFEEAAWLLPLEWAKNIGMVH